MTGNMKSWKVGIDFPEWANNTDFFTMIPDYLMEGEKPIDAYKRVSKSSAKYLGMPELADEFFQMIWDNILCLSSPVLSNSGTKRGLPISCFGIHVADDTSDIGMKLHELIMMSKMGGGVGMDHSDIRGAGSPISDIGTSDGVRPFIKMADTVIVNMKQGKVRKAASSSSLNVRHPDFFKTFLNMRRPEGYVSLQMQKMHHTAVIPDEFMEKVAVKKPEETKQYLDILKTRLETGESFLLYEGNANKANPPMYAEHNLKVRQTNICTEIMLHSDVDHSFVCCLSSLNLANYDKITDRHIKLAIYFLEGLMSEFIDKASKIKGFENSVRFAEKSRALGLGVLGWHSFLLQKDLPFISPASTGWTKIIFKRIQDLTLEASQELAVKFGEPEWCKGHGVRHTHRTAIAPTVSNSILHGGFSANHEPYPAVIWSEYTAKGLMFRKNKYFEKLLVEKGMDNHEIWRKIMDDNGSVQNLDFLSNEEKENFLTAMEIDQLELVKQAAARQNYIDQGMSLNTFFPNNATPKYLFNVHLEAWKLGIKSMYYLKSDSPLSADKVRKLESNSCISCDG